MSFMRQNHYFTNTLVKHGIYLNHLINISILYTIIVKAINSNFGENDILMNFIITS